MRKKKKTERWKNFLVDNYSNFFLFVSAAVWLSLFPNSFVRIVYNIWTRKKAQTIRFSLGNKRNSYSNEKQMNK